MLATPRITQIASLKLKAPLLPIGFDSLLLGHNTQQHRSAEQRANEVLPQIASVERPLKWMRSETAPSTDVYQFLLGQVKS